MKEKKGWIVAKVFFMNKKEKISANLTLVALLIYSDISQSKENLRPPNLCKKNEMIFSTCENKKTKKIASICAAIASEKKDFDFIEYRFGTTKSIELIQRFDKETKNTNPLYRGIGKNYEVNYGFIRQGYYYVISIPEQKLDSQASIWITDLKTKSRSVAECTAGLKYWDGGDNKLTETNLITDADGDEIFISQDGKPRQILK